MAHETRDMIRAHLLQSGDLGRVAERALAETDWTKLVPFDRRFLPETWASGSTNTSVSLPGDLVSRLEAEAARLGTKPGRLLEGAIRAWADQMATRNQIRHPS
ncbi:MAG TPA: hypothetical protein VGU69_10505 [Rhizomicrobium sp.]|nr:hypothetical protein [Rhizomicrobium sp.]